MKVGDGTADNRGYMRVVVRHCAVLFISLVLVGLVAWPLAFNFKGNGGLAAALVAAGICLVAGMLSLMANEAFRGPQFVMHHVLFGITIRMGIPLVACMWIYYNGGTLAEGGLVYYLLVFYLVTLLVETMLATKQQLSESTTNAKAT